MKSQQWILRFIRSVVSRDIRLGGFLQDASNIAIDGDGKAKYSTYDYYRYKICKYRFLLETIIENSTVYKDTFLLIKYLEVLLENQIKEELQGLPISEAVLVDKLNDAFDDLKKFFPFVLNVNRMDAINNIRSRLINGKSKSLPILSEAERQYMMVGELFIHKQLSDPKTFRNKFWTLKSKMRY